MIREAFVVIGDSANRDIGVLLKKKVNEALERIDDNEAKVEFHADLTPAYGKVLVVISGEGAEEKKQDGMKKRK